MEPQALLEEIFNGKDEGLIAFLESGGDANTIDPKWNCSMIYHAIYSGNVVSVQRLIDAGADVNLASTDPGPDILAATPLALAMQCELMMDSEKYQPIVNLLKQHGAQQEPVSSSSDKSSH